MTFNVTNGLNYQGGHPNSGLVSCNATVNASFKLKNGLAITLGYRFPISQKTLSGAGDIFTYGSTFVLNASYLFK